MESDVERCRPRARKPDMALYVPKARRGSVLPISSHQEMSSSHLNAVVKQGQEEGHLPSKNDVFRVSSELQRPVSNPSRQEHKARDGKRPNSKSKKGTCLKERSRGKFHTQKGTPESEEMSNKNPQIPNPSSFSKVPSQIHFKPKKEEKCMDPQTSSITVPQGLLISQSSTETCETQASSKPFQSVKLCDFRKEELSGMNYAEGDLGNSVSPHCKVVEMVSRSQFSDELVGCSSLLNPDHVLAPAQPNSPSKIVQEIIHPAGHIMKSNTEDIKSIAIQGSPESVIDQACSDSEPKNVSDLSGPVFLSSEAGFLEQTSKDRLSGIGDPVSDHMHIVSVLENANDIEDPTCMSRESEKNGAPAEESHVCYEPHHFSDFADETSTGSELEDASDITSQACMSITDGTSDETCVGSTSTLVGGITEQACSSINSLLDGMGVSTYITPLLVANSLECGNENSSNLTVCTDGYTEDSLSSYQESMGGPTKSLSDCTSLIPIKKEASSNPDSCLDSEFYMLNRTELLSNKALSSNLDRTDDITESLNNLRTGEEFKTGEEDGFGKIEYTVSSDRQLELKALHPSSNDESAPTEESWDSLFNDDGDCLDPRLLEELSGSLKNRKSLQEPRFDYYNYEAPELDINDCEFPHVIEIYDFPQEFRTEDLLRVFCSYQKKGFDIKWVDDTHALGVFSSPITARDALSTKHMMVKVRPLSQATRAAKAKARACAEFLQPAKARPETSAALARRLVISALGVRSQRTKAERDAELKKLQEARERKRLEAKQREDIWEGRDQATV
ncbi:coiled-coil domain-containing protein R3HCC1L isoform X2 [Dromiciops gliroides]|uniref:coiled-coil domain-containing protein R3HCC1L isoform X2 n=1 Tax=Dromiciops gliroides TaxID=33562 RepID=UPI001CC57544|nr:coiled-coil domain-containing protein R3HCC1L isoform X2 [Dromiciops gliroides]